MTRFYKISSYLLLSFNLLLLFFLLFEAQVSLPLWMNPVGRMHPLLLHLPIGFSVILVVFLLLKNEFEVKTYKILVRLLLTFTALSASIVALMGFFLSKEGGFDADLLRIHKWTGTAVSFVSYSALVFYEKIKFTSKNYGSFGLLILIAIAVKIFGSNIVKFGR